MLLPWFRRPTNIFWELRLRRRRENVYLKYNRPVIVAGKYRQQYSVKLGYWIRTGMLTDGVKGYPWVIFKPIHFLRSFILKGKGLHFRPRISLVLPIQRVWATLDWINPGKVCNLCKWWNNWRTTNSDARSKPSFFLIYFITKTYLIALYIFPNIILALICPIPPNPASNNNFWIMFNVR